MDPIAFTKVTLPFGWLGNMSPHPVQWDDKVWRTTEALFQARRLAVGDPGREEIRAQNSPMGAKMVSKRTADRRVIVPMSKEDVELMESVLRLKLEQYPLLRDELEATGERLIIEDCTSRPSWDGPLLGCG